MSSSERTGATLDESRAARGETEKPAAAAASGGGDFPECSDGGEGGDRWFRTLDGHWLKYDAHRWSVPTPLAVVHIPVNDLPGATPAMAGLFRDYLIGRLKMVPASNVRRDHAAMRDLLRRTVDASARTVDVVDLDMVLAYEAMLFRTQPDCWRNVRALVGRLRKLRAGLLAPDLLGGFGSLPRRVAPRSSPAMLRCPRRGALNREEFDEVLRLLRVAVTEGWMSPGDYVLCLLILVLGTRVSQCALIKVSDLSPADEHGRRRLRVVTMKRKSGVFGSVAVDRTLSAALSRLMAEQADRARMIARSRGLDEDAAPIFPPSTSRVGSGGGDSRWAGHSFANTLGARFRVAIASLGIVSSRTGEALRVTPIRGRRTLGTRLRLAGRSDTQIADALGHQGTRHVNHYAEPSHKIAAAAANALARAFDAIAAAFRGTRPKPDGEGAA